MNLLKVVVVALSLALDVFAVSVGVGMRGVSAAQKFRIGAAFAAAEVGMTLVGIGLGKLAGRLLGTGAGYLGFAALIAVGAYMIVESRHESEVARLDLSRGGGLALASLSISLDSLGIGFSILYIGAPLPVALGAIALASIASTTAGLMLGAHIGRFAGRYAALAGGIALMLTGAIFALLKAHHLG